jgi:hypothetical protein
MNSKLHKIVFTVKNTGLSVCFKILEYDEVFKSAK